jgi:hypothetical protein
VVQKVAAVHQARFGASAPPPGFKSCYRLDFPSDRPGPPTH